MSILQRLKEQGYELPAPTPLAAAYVPYTMHNGLLVISGQLPIKDGKPGFIGKLGADVSIEQGQEAARHCVLQILMQAQEALGSLDRITKTLRLGGFVNGTLEFTDAPKVINGASDLIKTVLGDEKGKHARAALTVANLPFGVCVEVEALFAYE